MYRHMDETLILSNVCTYLQYIYTEGKIITINVQFKITIVLQVPCKIHSNTNGPINKVLMLMYFIKSILPDLKHRYSSNKIFLWHKLFLEYFTSKFLRMC